MARLSVGILDPNYVSGITLDRYQELMRLPIAAFNGLNDPTETPVYQCSTIWKQSERDNVAIYLSQSEEMRETELGYFISPKYVVDEELEIGNPYDLKKKFLIAMGKEVLTVVQAAVALDLTADPRLVTIVVATTVTDPNEIVVTYPGETVVIKPKSVTISGGNATIILWRARLVEPSLLDDRDDHLYFDDDANFINTVDVYQRTTDITQSVNFVWYERNFVENLQTGYPIIRDYRLSIVQAGPCTFTGVVPTSVCFTSCRHPRYVRFSYLSGRTMSVRTEIETIRLAHTFMPNAPCTCPTVHQYWQEDVALDPSKIVSPYGSSAGAVAAWLSDSRAKIGFGGKFPRVRPR